MPVKEETPSHWCPFSNSASTYLGTALQITWVQHLRHERFVNKKQEGLVAGVCWCSMTSVKLSADSVDEEKKSPVKAGNDSFWKWSWLTSPSIHGDLKKSRRCFLKESSILSKRIVGAKRENRRFFLKESSVLMGSKSIYSPKSLNCYVSGGNNTWQKHSKIIVFPLGFREVFSLLPSCLCGFIWSNTIEMGGFGKDTCFSDEIQCPYEDSCKSLNHS